MTLDQFLEQFVEGYLFEDLRAMAPLRVAEGKTCGGVGYPMVMAALSGVELLGVLTAETTFNRWKGEDRFCEFWRGFMYPDNLQRQDMALLVYQSVRHGLAHTFMTKPKFIVTKARDSRHLTRSADGSDSRDGSIFVDALTLMDELFAAYEKRVKPRMVGAFRIQIEARFKELRDSYWEEHEKPGTQALFTGVPVASVVRVSPGLPLAPNSPSVNAVYSTNVSKVIRDDEDPS